MSSVFLANNLPNEEHENILKLADSVDKEPLNIFFYDNKICNIKFTKSDRTTLK